MSEELIALDIGIGEKFELAFDLGAEYAIAATMESGYDIEAKAAEVGISRPNLVAAVRKLFTDDDYHRKVFGYGHFEATLMHEYGLALEEARYVSEHPCIEDAYERCDHYKENKKCSGCTNWNGWLYFKTSSDAPIRPNIKVQERFMKKPVLNLDVEKAIREGNLDEELNGFLSEVESDVEKRKEQ
jgi:hypothetical protein